MVPPWNHQESLKKKKVLIARIFKSFPDDFNKHHCLKSIALLSLNCPPDNYLKTSVFRHFFLKSLNSRLLQIAVVDSFFLHIHGGTVLVASFTRAGIVFVHRVDTVPRTEPGTQ